MDNNASAENYPDTVPQAKMKAAPRGDVGQTAHATSRGPTGEESSQAPDGSEVAKSLLTKDLAAESETRDALVKAIFK